MAGDRMAKPELELVKSRLRPKTTKPKVVKGLSTGSTLLNLAMTGHVSYGISQGSFVLLVGASRAGKTWVALQTLCEAAINKEFKDHRLVCHKPEHGARMNLEKYFPPLAKRIEWRSPRVVEEFYYLASDDMKKGPCVFVLDSMDALVPREDREKFNERKQAFLSGKEVAGSYGMNKAKDNSANLREIVNDCEATGSIFICIAQSRTNVGFGSQFRPETYSGGKAMRFYCNAEVWFKIKNEFKARVKGKDETIGHRVICKVEKNRESGWEPDIEMHHFISHGMDDVGGNVAFLVERGHWKEKDKKVHAPEFKFEGSTEALIKQIDNPEGRRTLRLLTAELWRDIESQCKIERQPRYV